MLQGAPRYPSPLAVSCHSHKGGGDPILASLIIIQDAQCSFRYKNNSGSSSIWSNSSNFISQFYGARSDSYRCQSFGRLGEAEWPSKQVVLKVRPPGKQRQPHLLAWRKCKFAGRPQTHWGRNSGGGTQSPVFKRTPPTTSKEQFWCTAKGWISLT